MVNLQSPYGDNMNKYNEFQKARSGVSVRMTAIEKIFRNNEFSESAFGVEIISRIEAFSNELDLMREAWNSEDVDKIKEAFIPPSE